MTVIPIGISRISNSLLLDRSLYTLQQQNVALAKYNQQITSEQRYQYGSEAPFDASVSLSVQMQMERKNQNATNLSATQSYLSATDSTLAQITTMLDEVRAMALDAINTTTSGTQREALSQSVKQKTQSIFDFGNYKFRDRFLFSGATTSVKPFTWGSDSYTIDYVGSTANLFSWSDTDLLSQSNASGASVFGAVSEPVKGASDLNPSLSGSTLLSTLNGGIGVQSHTIRLTYDSSQGTREYIVDLSSCVTIDDVRNTLAKSAPEGTGIKVGITADSLSIEFESEDPTGSITIRDIGSFLTARNLGINTTSPIRSGTTFIGADIDPALTRTTPLDSLLGSKAQTTLRFPGTNNDLVIQARDNGESFLDSQGNPVALNGMRIAMQSNAKVPVGSEYAQYDPDTNTVLVYINPDNTTAAHIAAAINRASEEGTIPPISASMDPMDQVAFGKNSAATGAGLVKLLPDKPTVFGTLEGGSGEAFDKTHGLQIVNGGITHTIDLSNCKTFDDLLAVLNDPAYGLLAEINESKTGINVQSRISGADFTIGENGGITATQLGIRTMTENTFLQELDFNRGVMDFEGPGTNASAQYQTMSANSGLMLSALAEGPEWNDFEVNFVPTRDPDGKVSIAWDPEGKTITIGINPGVTKACEVVAAFNEQPGPNQAFELLLDGTLGINTGQGVVYDGTANTAGGTNGGIDFYITCNDGTVLDIDIHGAKTIGDVLDLINNHPLNNGERILAQLSEFGNGIELIDRSIGTTAMKVERAKLSTAAIDLGLIPRNSEYSISNAGGNRPSVHVDSGTTDSDLLILGQQGGTYGNGTRVEFHDMNAAGGNGIPGFFWDANEKVLRFEIDPGTTTAAEVIKLYQENASAELRNVFDFQNGVNPDGSPSDGSGLLALFPRPTDPDDPESETISAPQLSGGTDYRLIGTDPNPLETESVFTALIRMQVAMDANDVREIERAANLLDKTVKKVDSSRADVGIRQNTLDTVMYRIEDEYVQLTQTLTNSLQIDISQTILQYNAAMLSYEATLQVTSQMFQMSLLNYL